MTTIIVTHTVNDVKHWLASPKRAQVFGPLGLTFKTFTDPAGTNKVGLVVEVPDMGTFQKFMQTPAAAEAMKYDGVNPETLQILVAA